MLSSQLLLHLLHQLLDHQAGPSMSPIGFLRSASWMIITALYSGNDDALLTGGQTVPDA
jgi:hypothetical protein